MKFLSLLLLPLFSLLPRPCNADDDKWLSPEYNSIFEHPLPIPPEIQPLATYTEPSSGTPIDFYQLNISAFQAKTYPDRGPAHLVGYNGMSPGPTFRIQRGRESIVRVVNQYDRPSALHLHGSATRPVWDGWAEDLIHPGEYKDYYYPNNNSARTLFYHDHAATITAQNVFQGQSGFYILEDPDLEKDLGLPQGEYDIPLGLASKQYNDDGDLISASDEDKSLYGDVIEVNGQPWPFLAVEPRKYRFRLLDMSLSRTFQISIIDLKGHDVEFQVVATDSGFTDSPVPVTSLTIAMAERYEVVVDFASYAGQNLTMQNARDVFADDDYAATDKVMLFKVGSRVSSNDNNGPIPASLVPTPVLPSTPSVDRTFKFDKDDGDWKINNVSFSDVNHRVLARPSQGATEIWSLENHNSDWSHPVHIHMVDFQILSRSKGRKSVQAYEKAGLKDVVTLGPDERVKVLVQFAPFAGLYMFHCHNLIHEDHGMMAAFNVSAIQGLGYDETDLSFSDPMDATWRARTYSGTKLASIDEDVLARFAATKAYRSTGGVGSLFFA